LKKFVVGFFLKIFFGILMIWISAAVICVLGGALLHLTWTSPTAIVFTIGFVVYFPIHFMLYKPVLSHVMAHEVTHALAALAMGGKVTEIHATHSGGSTITNKSHFFISMAPYVIPLYTLIALFLYLIAAPGLKIYLIGLVGFTYAFHWVLTVYSLSHHQPDLDEGGVVFSLIFIFTANIIVLMLLFSMVWPDTLSLSQALVETYRWGLRLAQAAFHQLHLLFSPPEGKSA
jgi:hypothetical protein